LLFTQHGFGLGLMRGIELLHFTRIELVRLRRGYECAAPEPFGILKGLDRRRSLFILVRFGLSLISLLLVQQGRGDVVIGRAMRGDTGLEVSRKDLIRCEGASYPPNQGEGEKSWDCPEHLSRGLGLTYSDHHPPLGINRPG
jgi:hypothetical protein